MWHGFTIIIFVTLIYDRFLDLVCLNYHPSFLPTLSCWACCRLRMQKVFVSGSTLNPHQLNIVLIDYVFWLVYLSDASA